MKFVPKSSINISSDNGWVLTRPLAIIWTNDGNFTDVYLRHSASLSSLQAHTPSDEMLTPPVFRMFNVFKIFIVLNKYS